MNAMDIATLTMLLFAVGTGTGTVLSLALTVGSFSNKHWAVNSQHQYGLTFGCCLFVVCAWHVPVPTQVAAAAKKPVVLVTMTATPLDLTDQLANAKVGR